MMCQRCGQRAATTHIKTVVNGQLSESHLCSVCAKEQGYGHLLSEWNGFGGLLSGHRCRTKGGNNEKSDL